jgi:Domain of unknown function (DUF1906)
VDSPVRQTWRMGFIRNTIITVFIPVVSIVGAVGPANAGQAAGWRTVTFDAVSLQVPSAWPVQNLVVHPAICPLLDRHAVYVGHPGPDPACPSAAFGKTDAVLIQPADPQSPDVAEAQVPTLIGGRPAMTSGDASVTHTVIDVLPEAGVEVSLSYGGDPALARQIESTIKVGAGARAIPPPGPATVPATVPATGPATGPAPTRQRLFTGRGFDSCAAPSAVVMSRWLASPYRAVGIYIGGLNRTCEQANLTRAWIARIQAAGWFYFPMYVGLQPPCTGGRYGVMMDARKAGPEGAASADDAAAQAGRLGIPRGTPIIYDMEAYRGCGAPVIAFMNRWDRELHARGYLAGAYWNLIDLGSLTRAAGRMAEPDVISYAHWDGQPTTRSSYMPARMWTGHQRIHQYTGAVPRTWGRVTLNIDLDKLDLRLPHP